MKAIKRSFFDVQAERQSLSKTVEAVRGIYSAIRMTDVRSLLLRCVARRLTSF